MLTRYITALLSTVVLGDCVAEDFVASIKNAKVEERPAVLRVQIADLYKRKEAIANNPDMQALRAFLENCPTTHPEIIAAATEFYSTFDEKSKEALAFCHNALQV